MAFSSNSPVPVQTPIAGKDLVSPVWANWFRQSRVQGDTGIQGSTGVPGTTGIAGINGATGIQGLVGATGIQGITGVRGVAGACGVQGVTGLVGATGIQGVTGLVGATGIQGPGVQDITRSITSSTNATVEIGYINLSTNSSFDCGLAVTSTAAGFTFSGIWRATGYANCTAGAWQLLTAERWSGDNAAQTYGVEMKVDSTTAYFRVRELRTIV